MCNGVDSMFDVLLLILLVGAICIYIGMRGRPVPTELRCARCDYIVEYLKDAPEPRCPECGSDLQVPNSVQYGKIRRRYTWIIAGVLLLAFAFALPATSRFFSARRSPPVAVAAIGGRDAPTPTLLKDLRARPYDFWMWQELERRQRNVLMTSPEIAQAIEILIARFEAEPEVQRTTFRGDKFLLHALSTDQLSPDQHLRLAQAFHGRDPVVMLQPRCHPGDLVEFGVARQFLSDLQGVVQLTALKEVTANGKSIDLYPRLQDNGVMNRNTLSSARGSSFNGRLLIDLPIGRHTLIFYFHRGTTAHSDSFQTGNFSTPGAPEIWPEMLASWESAVSARIEVVPSDSSLLEQVTDLALAPRQSLEIAALIDIFALDANKLTVQVNLVCRDLKVPLCGTLYTDLDGERICLGSIQAEGQVTKQRFTAAIPKLGPDVRTLDLVIAPDPKRAEQKTTFKRIWASPVALNEVPVSRRDLEGVQTQPAQP